MELIPIIKYALTVVSGLSLIIIVISYTLYKIKNSKKLEEVSAEYSLVPAVNSNFTQNLPAKNLFHEKFSVLQVPQRQVRSGKNKPVTAKPGKRFMVINEDHSSYKFNPEKPLQTVKHFTDDLNNRQGLNILYNNYSSNSSEPLKRFGI